MRLDQVLTHLNSRDVRISIEPVFSIFMEPGPLLLSRELMVHNHDFCRFVKRCDNATCLNNKLRSIEIASRGKRFSGVCPFGVWELVQPILFENKLAAILYLGDFSGPDGLRLPNDATAYRGKLPPPLRRDRLARYRGLATFLREFVLHELELLAGDGKLSSRRCGPLLSCNMAEEYISLHFKENIQVEEVAEFCGLSPNHFGKLLLKHTGYSFRQLLTRKRLAEADLLLQHCPELSIGDVGRLCGYSDSNYFCAVFHRSRGCSPREFRRRWREENQSRPHQTRPAASS